MHNWTPNSIVFTSASFFFSFAFSRTSSACVTRYFYRSVHLVLMGECWKPLSHRHQSWKVFVAFSLWSWGFSRPLVTQRNTTWSQMRLEETETSASFTPHTIFLLLIQTSPITKCEPFTGKLLQKSHDYPFIVMNPKSSPILFADNPCLRRIKEYAMKPGKRYVLKLPFSAVNTMQLYLCVMKSTGRGRSVSSAVIAASLEMVSPVRFHCVECFISKQWFNALWSTTSCSSYTSSEVLLENTWGEEERWGWTPHGMKSLRTERDCADWAVLRHRPWLYSGFTEVWEVCATAAVFAKKGERPQQNAHRAFSVKEKGPGAGKIGHVWKNNAAWLGTKNWESNEHVCKLKVWLLTCAFWAWYTEYI